MLKIYLDWNCITNIESRDPELFELIQKCSTFVIFPYSIAHIRDVLAGYKRKSIKHRKEFYHDVQNLAFISQLHYLYYDKNTGINSFYRLPMEVIRKCGSTLTIISRLKLFSAWLYYSLKNGVQKKIPQSHLKRIKGASYETASREIEDSINGLSLSKIKQTAVRALDYNENDNIEVKIKKFLLKLDIFGYKTEKANKSLSNIDADGSHTFYAAFCDYLVTNDKKMAEKAKAVYSELSIPTKVITTKELKVKLKEFLDNKIGKGLFSLESFLGLFGIVERVDTTSCDVQVTNSFLLKYNYERYNFVYKDEILLFLARIKSTLPVSEIQNFEDSYENKILSSNPNEVATAKYMWADNIILFSEIKSSVSLPCMIVMQKRE